MKFNRRSTTIAAGAVAILMTGVLAAAPAFARGHGQGARAHLKQAATIGRIVTDGRGLHLGVGEGMGLLGGTLLHGTGVIARPSLTGAAPTFANVSFQSGTVTAVNAAGGTLTIQSTDGVVWTWTTDANTMLFASTGSTGNLADFKLGDMVTAVGTGAGSGSLAAFIRVNNGDMQDHEGNGWGQED